MRTSQKILKLDEDELIYLAIMLRRLRTAKLRERIRKEMAKILEEEYKEKMELMGSLVKN